MAELASFQGSESKELLAEQEARRVTYRQLTQTELENARLKARVDYLEVELKRLKARISSSI